MNRKVYCPLFALLALALSSVLFAPAAAQPAVAERFLSYYTDYQGPRTLGPPISGLVSVNGYPAQYFEKARLEDHRAENGSGVWGLLFGRLTAELMQRYPQGQVSATPITYERLATEHAVQARVPPPAGFRGGVQSVRGGVFIPYDPQLQPVPGYVVTPYFWQYMNRQDLFPSGWLHDIGLPMTGPFRVDVVKFGQDRQITMQAFERTVLTYDPQNPAAWQVERANLGTDAVQAFGLPQPSTLIDVPVAGATTTLPLHIQARVGQPGGQVIGILRWADGTQLIQILPVLPAGDDNPTGWVVTNMNWLTESQPPQPTTNAAALELRTGGGELIAQQSITVLPFDAPGTRRVTLYFLIEEDLVPVTRVIADTPAIATATLRELLWGPTPGNLAGFTTAIPTPQEVLTFPGREPDWGPRVQLLDLTITNGVATANFSQEMRAYGGGSARVQAISQQIRQTLLQFPTVTSVQIAIEGETEGVLQP